LDYRHRKAGLFEDIFNNSSQGLSNRAIARNLKVSESTIRNKIKHLARQSLLHWESYAKKLNLNEPVAYDGFETFVFSQYDPNNINHVVGKNSLYLYDFSYSHLNRKGRMTPAQKLKMRKIEEKKGRYPSNRVRVQTLSVLKYLESINRERKETILYTDEHRSYKLALDTDLRGHHFDHRTISSRAFRGPSNPLFPINHLDLKLRHFLKSCTRETIAFNKNEMGLIDRYVLHAIQKNFLRSRLIKGRQEHRTHSPAMLVGLTDRILSFKEFFKLRLTRYQVKLRDEWVKYYQRIVDCSRLPCRLYQGT